MQWHHVHFTENCIYSAEPCTLSGAASVLPPRNNMFHCSAVFHGQENGLPCLADRRSFTKDRVEGSRVAKIFNGTV